MSASTAPSSYLPDAVPLAQVRRALVIKLRHHGDVLLASPVLSALKAAAPHCEIDALVFADTAAMLAGHAALAQLHSLDRNAKKRGALNQLREEWAVLSALRTRQYDLIIHLTDHPRGAWLSRLLGARWAVAPVRSKGAKWWKKSFTHLYKTVGGGRRHTVDTHLDALRRIGIQPQDQARKLSLVPGATAEASVDARLSSLGVAAGSFIHFHPASRWFFKCWPVAQCAGLLAQLSARGETVVISGAPDARERGMVEAILAQAGVAAINLTGELSLKELAALAARAKLFIGVDSAPMHIAAAVGTPCVALFGPSGDREWGPWMVRHEIVTSAHPCRPCGQDGCGGGKVSECLTTIPVAQVLAAVDRVLGNDKPRG
ncbi:putative lipopolysaccharide heptosyltransferase III [Uliginosibacterium sediminicola]|uniref:Lipopolysaccharide heptosyltransferase III n=1 Tax=Uliginosibacterium sediminicola TaxID=2024550 RepID=A0ABU9YX89_9RHOO